MRLASARTRSLQNRVKRCPGKVPIVRALTEKGLNKLASLIPRCFRYRTMSVIRKVVHTLEKYMTETLESTVLKFWII
jgi:hypothetical protein